MEFLAGRFCMTISSAKVLALTALERRRRRFRGWSWLVLWPRSVGETEGRWFISEERAREFAALMPHSEVVRLTFNGPTRPTYAEDEAATDIDFLGINDQINR